MTTIKPELRAFLSRQLRGSAPRDEDDLFALGFVNSLFAVQLVQFVEKKFAIAIESEDLDMANFRSIDAIARLVERKL